MGFTNWHNHRLAIAWTSADFLSSGINFSAILMDIQISSFNTVYLKVSDNNSAILYPRQWVNCIGSDIAVMEVFVLSALSIVSVKHDCLSIGNQWLISSNGHRISAGHRISKYIGNVLFEPVARDRFDWEFSGGACTINHILQSYMEYNCLSML